MHRYTRTYYFAASHFNGREQYEKVVRLHRIGVDINLAASFSDVMELLRGCHGHNFVVTVDVQTSELDAEGFVFDDVLVEKIVNKWQNTNLSVHPDFWRPVDIEAGIINRATAERMAQVLCNKVRAVVTQPGVVTVKCTVQETPHIKAEYSLQDVNP